MTSTPRNRTGGRSALAAARFRGDPGHALTQASRVHERHWVTQCALARICGGCAMSLGRPIAFLGTPDEVARNAFHLPPMHTACAEELRRTPGADPTWQLVTTAGFEFVRPATEDLDREPRFEPNSLL